MRLSNIYTNKVLWALVYHTQPGNDEVEFITHKFFKSPKAAMKWFNRKRNKEDYIEPATIALYGINNLVIDQNSINHF